MLVAHVTTKDELTLTAVQEDTYSQNIILFLMTNKKMIQYQFFLCYLNLKTMKADLIVLISCACYETTIKLFGRTLFE